MKISELALNPYISDLKLQLPGQEEPTDFHSHKFLLATSSSVFNEIFKNNPQIDTIVLPRPIQPQKAIYNASIANNKRDFKNVLSGQLSAIDILSKVVQLTYLIVENLDKAKEQALKLIDKQNCLTYYGICQALGLEGAKNIFERHVVEQMNLKDDAIQLLLEAVQYESQMMKDTALNLIVPKFQDFMRSAFFYKQIINLPYDAFKSLIQRDDLQVLEEADVFNLVYQYILQRENDPEQEAIQTKEESSEIKQNEKDQLPIEQSKQNPGAEENLVSQEDPPPGEEKVEVQNDEKEKKESEAVAPVESIDKQLSQDQNVFTIPDNIEEKAKERLKTFKLTSEQKQELLLSIRLGYISHQNLLKFSNLEILKEFKQIFLNAISSKLNQFDSQEFLEKYEFKLDPRKNYEERVNNLSMVKNSFGATNTNLDKIQESPIKNKDHSTTPKSMNHFPSNFEHSPNKSKSDNNFNAVGNHNSANPLVPSLQLLIQGLSTSLQQQQQQQQSHSQVSTSRQNNQQTPLTRPYQVPSFSQNISQISNNQSHPPPIPSPKTSVLANQSLSLWNNKSTLQFVYKYDMDDNGSLYYIGTLGKTKPYCNPHILGRVQAFGSSVRAGKVDFLVGRELQNLSTLNEKNSYLGVDFGENRLLVPTAYSIRNRNSSTYVLLNWILEASVDGINYIPIDKRVYYDPYDVEFNRSLEKDREILKQRGAVSSYGIDELFVKKTLKDNSIQGFRFFRIVQISQNSHGSYNLSLSGLEIYGTGIGKGWT